ncbi:helix-turn-helix transcriptional regulator [Mesorhizobium sp. YR577]|uniref:helix-turn-helix domain-containing protein n=1 Tax=Mesorhizobium sp. YR577 TaxID=1884373 RepID=UPI0008E267DC|nr:helix-turn-helix transcriptional regulator [Mesorhizobium sp. YR577]SFU21706.1 Helix-turn-helix [Mesorhizobium sp. YR577]
MITASQMRAARELLGIDQKNLADRAGISLSAIQRMEAGDSDLRGGIDIQKKVISAFRAAGVEIIGDHERSHGGGRGVRLAHPVGLTGRTH